jgi:hypothetical protein
MERNGTTLPFYTQNKQSELIARTCFNSNINARKGIALIGLDCI